MRILLAEDEHAMSEAVSDILSYHHYTVDAVFDGEDALAYAMAQHYDAMILDIMMPKMDGVSVLKALRAAGNPTPVLLLTAKSEIESRVTGLDAGADDYLCKPFAMGELLARVRAMLRRREPYTPQMLSVGNVTLNQGSGTLMCGELVQPLSRLEFGLMELLMRHPGITLSGSVMLERVWGYDSEAQADTLRVYMTYLRRKLSLLHANLEIRSKRGVGYSLEVKQE